MSTEPLGWPPFAPPRARCAPAPATQPPGLLAESDFRRAVEMLPLVSIDLLLRDAEGRYLTGLRSNPPAQGSWFVPGGRIRKNETLPRALQRIVREELGLTLPPQAWRPRG
ncbi:NUDIX domain-containing protein, partial [Achromobacter xylosoxidans]